MRIVDVQVIVYAHPMPPQHAWRNFGQVQEVSLVKVVTDEGVEGYGSARAQGGTGGRVIAESILKTARPLLLGQDPLDRERIWQRLWALDRGGYLPIFATSALDVALWDIAGKVAGLPLWKLLGGARTSLPAYASSARHARPEEYAEEALACRERGYPAYKLHPPGSFQADLAACTAVRDAVGPEYVLMSDPTGAYDHRTALRMGRALEALGYYWYEEPLSDYDLAGYAELCRALDIPILGGETVAGSVRLAAEYVLRGAVDVLRGDVYWKGGITGLLKMAHLAEAHGMKLEIHHGASPLMDWANLHVACAIANCEFFEVLVPESKYAYGLQAYPHPDRDGQVHAPNAPGLGVAIDWDYVNGHRIDA
ncbi:MAG TPA: enolase C-terminal domain-like protein [Chloroflexota bacterium]